MSSLTQVVRRRVVLAACAVGMAISFRDLGKIDEGIDATAIGIEEALFTPGSNPFWLIGLLALGFGVRRYRRFEVALNDPSRPILGSSLLVCGFSLALWASFVSAPPLLLIALTLSILGGAALLGGDEGLRAARLPALFLLLALPIPTVGLNLVMYPLQLATAEATGMILRAFGSIAIVSGEYVHYRDTVFHVIESCSGVRSVMTLVMASIVYSELLDLPRLRSLCLVLSAPIVGLILNQLRILTIIFNPHSEVVGVHTTQGIVTIVVGVVVLALIDWGLERMLARSADAPPHRPDLDAGIKQVSESRRPYLLLAAATGLAGASLLIQPWVPPEDTAKSVSYFPGAWMEWREAGRRQVDRKDLGSVGYDKCMVRRYYRDPDYTEIMMCTDRRLEGGNRMLSDKLVRSGPGWEIDRTRRLQSIVRPDADPVELRVQMRGSERQVVASMRAGVEATWIELLRGALWLDRGPLHRSRRAVVVRVSSDVADDQVSLDRALSAVTDFVNDFDAPLAEFGAR